MTIDFSGRVAIVTGAGRGMGREMALALARRGASVLVNDYGGAPTTIDPGTIDVAEAVAEEIRAMGGKAVANGDSVGTGASAQAIVDAAVKAFGRLDILVNNAGGAILGEIDAFSDDEIEGVLRTNFIGPYMLMRRAWPIMREQRYGRILNIMSSAILGIGTLGPYSSGKAGLIGLTAEAAIEGVPLGIKVNGLFPAGFTRLAAPDGAVRDWMETHFKPWQVAEAVAFLVSETMPATGEIFHAGAGRVSRSVFKNGAGYHHPALTAERLAENFEQARSVDGAETISSSWAELQRYFPVAPWQGDLAEGIF